MSSEQAPSLVTFDDEPVKIQSSQLSTFITSMAAAEMGPAHLDHLLEEVNISMPPAKIAGHEETAKPHQATCLYEPVDGLLPVAFEGFDHWSGMWWPTQDNFEADWVAGWVASQCAGVMGCWPECHDNLWQMPCEPPPSLPQTPQMPPPPPPLEDPPLPNKKLEHGSSVEYSGESTEAEDMTSGSASEDESLSDNGFNNVDFDGEKAGMELLAILNGNSQEQQPDDVWELAAARILERFGSSEEAADVGGQSVDVMRPLTPPPGLPTPPPGLCRPRPITPPPGLSGLCSPRSITPPPGLSGFCSAASLAETSGSEADVSRQVSSADVSGSESDHFTPQDESSPTSGQDAAALSLQQPACRKLNKLRQQRTPGSAKAKKVRASPMQPCTEAQCPDQVMAVDASIMEEHASDESPQIVWWHMLLLASLVLVAVAIAVLVVGPMCFNEISAHESSASVAVTPGSSHAWAAAVPGAASMKNQNIASLAKSMNIQIARGHAVASHVTTKVKEMKAVFKKARKNKKIAGQ